MRWYLFFSSLLVKILPEKVKDVLKKDYRREKCRNDGRA
jgi:hypothetical protein